MIRINVRDGGRMGEAAATGFVDAPPQVRDGDRPRILRMLRMGHPRVSEGQMETLKSLVTLMIHSCCETALWIGIAARRSSQTWRTEAIPRSWTVRNRTSTRASGRSLGPMLFRCEGGRRFYQKAVVFLGFGDPLAPALVRFAFGLVQSSGRLAAHASAESFPGYAGA